MVSHPHESGFRKQGWQGEGWGMLQVFLVGGLWGFLPGQVGPWVATVSVC